MLSNGIQPVIYLVAAQWSDCVAAMLQMSTKLGKPDDGQFGGSTSQHALKEIPRDGLCRELGPSYAGMSSIHGVVPPHNRNTWLVSWRLSPSHKGSE